MQGPIRLALVLAVVIALAGGAAVYFRANAEPTEQHPTADTVIQAEGNPQAIDQHVGIRVCEILETAGQRYVDASTPCVLRLGDEPIPFGAGMPYIVGEQGEAHFLDAYGNTMWTASNCYFAGHGPFSGVLVGPAKIRPNESEYHALPQCEDASRPAG